LNFTAEADTLKDMIAQEVMLLMLKALSLKDEGLGSILNRVSVLFA
jgi:hypothetical protein